MQDQKQASMCEKGRTSIVYLTETRAKTWPLWKKIMQSERQLTQGMVSILALDQLQQTSANERANHHAKWICAPVAECGKRHESKSSLVQLSPVYTCKRVIAWEQLGDSKASHKGLENRFAKTEKRLWNTDYNVHHDMGCHTFYWYLGCWIFWLLNGSLSHPIDEAGHQK